jgi:hypothetical protein
MHHPRVRRAFNRRGKSVAGIVPTAAFAGCNRTPGITRGMPGGWVSQERTVRRLGTSTEGCNETRSQVTARGLLGAEPEAISRKSYRGNAEWQVTSIEADQMVTIPCRHGAEIGQYRSSLSGAESTGCLMRRNGGVGRSQLILVEPRSPSLTAKLSEGPLRDPVKTQGT